MSRLVVAFVALSIGVSGAHASTGTAGSFLRATVIQLLHGQYDRVWSTLYPAQQKIVGLPLYTRCAKKELGALGALHSVKVVDQYKAIGKTTVPGTRLKVAVEAVTLRLHYGTQSEDVTLRASQVDGHWRWILERRATTAYSRGACP